MFGNLGLSELVVIFAVALVAFGPRRLPEIARMMGRALAQFRRWTSDLQATVERETQVSEFSNSLREFKSGISSPFTPAAVLAPPVLARPVEPPAASPPSEPAVEPAVATATPGAGDHPAPGQG